MLSWQTVIELDYGYVVAIKSPIGLRQLSLPKVNRCDAVNLLNSFGLSENTSAEDHFYNLEELLQSYYAGKSVNFDDVKLDLSGVTSFRRKVLDCVRGISRGSLVTYGKVADLVGRPRAARAVGATMAFNPICVVIPCHRVVAAGGKLGGFQGGVEMKRWMIELEVTRI